MPENTFYSFIQAVNATVTAPVEWLKGSVITPNQKDYPWYHRQFRRVPTIDQCYTDDVTCFYEANEQFKRDKQVDDEILKVLRRRRENCYQYEYHDKKTKCAPLKEDYELASTEWFIKYGDLGAYKNVKKAYMKQKHRMVWERRHGEVGSGNVAQEAS